ncbi:PspC domain-containing protein [Cryobacterium sp. Y11]|uniref:PspC domain-containing protein n=1 Tax=Cryobacterium sp. Y11 TaxID=2045016 RepID=UPI000CE37A25|nr:PspC domain-containing protein [Cryobacterium sp. Y11]
MTDAPHTPPTPASSPTWRDQLSRFFTWIRFSGLNRESDRWLLGVCGAIARRTGLDPLIVRGVAIVLAIVGAPVLFAYALGWALFPGATGRIHADEAIRGNFTAPTVTSIVLLVATASSFAQGFHWAGPNTGWILPSWLPVFFSVAWWIAITVGIVWLVVYLVRRGKNQRPGGPTSWADAAPRAAQTPTGSAFGPAQNTSASSHAAASTAAPSATRPRESWESTEQNHLWQEQYRVRQEQQQARRTERAATRRASLPGAGFTAIVLGLALATGALTAGVIASDSTIVPSAAALVVGLAVTVGVIAMGLIVSGIRGRRGGALGALALLATVSLVAVGVFPAGTQFAAAGDLTWQVPASVTDDRPGYALGFGQATIDLRRLDGERSADSRVIDVWVGVGQTRIILPDSTPVRVQSHAIVGGVDSSSDSGGQQQNGLFLNETRTFNSGDSSTGSTRALIRVWSYIGQITIIEPANTTNR